MPTRRRVLVAAGGGGVLAAAAVLGVDGRDRTRLLHRLGLTHSPDASVARSTTPVARGTLRSRFMAGDVRWSMSTPGVVRGVIVCLHGKGADHRMAFDSIRIPDFVAASGHPLAVAAVDGGADSYWHPRRDGTDALGMLLHEFVPLVDSRLGQVPRAVMGWSMGGYGALLAAEQAPTTFRAVAATSAALWRTPGATAPGAFDDADDYHRYDVYASTDRLRGVAVRVDCGTGDPFYGADRAFVARLPAGYQSSFGAGFHEDSYWRSRAPAQIEFITAALGISRT